MPVVLVARGDAATRVQFFQLGRGLAATAQVLVLAEQSPNVARLPLPTLLVAARPPANSELTSLVHVVPGPRLAFLAEPMLPGLVRDWMLHAPWMKEPSR